MSLKFNIVLVFLVLHLASPSSSSSAAASPSDGGEVIRYSVPEDLPPGTFIGNVKVNSSLLQRFGSLVYNDLLLNFHQTPQALTSLFLLDSRNGALWSAKTLDREQLTLTSIELSIRVTPFQYFHMFKVIVTLVDRNDHAPVFPEPSISLLLSETTRVGSVFVLPSADDKDSGVFGVASYELVSDCDKFAVRATNNSDGSVDVRLVVVRELDRERAESYDLSLIAWDGGEPALSGHVTISVLVLDANDNSPRFLQSEYEVSVMEDGHYGMMLLHLTASDADDGANGQMTYGLASTTDDVIRRLFFVDNVTGDVILRGKLDYEVTRVYTFSVAVRDQGHSPLTSYAKVIIKVKDVNDNAPRITVHALGGQGEVTENCLPGTLVTQVTVIDPDEGDNGRVNCSIEGQLFDLHLLSPTEFQVRTRGSIDREEREMHHVTVTCSDNGRTPLVDVRTLTVKVNDENDNSPLFASATYNVDFRENNSIGSVVVVMNATDLDLGQNANTVYSMVEAYGTLSNIMSIDSSTGTVRALTSLDYESGLRWFAYVVKATDASDAHRFSTTLLNVTLADTNDEIPKFTRASYMYNVKENAAAPLKIATIHATDADGSLYNRVFYSLTLTDSTSVGCFAIDKLNGQLAALKSLDREMVDTYTFTIIASNLDPNDVIMPGDVIVSNSVNVTVRVLDENDNAPIFIFPSAHNNSILAQETAPINSLVTTLLVSDLDLNSTITFIKVAGDPNDLFSVDTASGEVLVSKPLTNYNNLELELIVSATDSGVPPLSVTEVLYIRITQTSAAPSLSLASLVTLLTTGDRRMVVWGVTGGLLLVLACVILAILIRRCRLAAGKKRELRAVNGGDIPVNKPLDEASCMLYGHRPQYHQQEQVMRMQTGSWYGDMRTAGDHGRVQSQGVLDSEAVLRPLTVRWREDEETDACQHPITMYCPPTQRITVLTPSKMRQSRDVTVLMNDIRPMSMTSQTDCMCQQYATVSHGRLLTDRRLSPIGLVTEPSDDTSVADSGQGGSSEEGELTSNRHTLYSVRRPITKEFNCRPSPSTCQPIWLPRARSQQCELPREACRLCQCQSPNSMFSLH